LQITHPNNAEADLSDFDAVVRGNQRKIFRFLLSSLRDPDLAETLTQECFFKAYKARHRFRREAQVSTWLTAIAVNLLRDHYRSKRLHFWRRIKSDSIELADIGEWLPDNGRTAEQQAVAHSQVNAISRAVARLSTAQRTVFLLRYVEDFDLKEIGQSTGMTKGSIKSNLHRALEKVRKQIIAKNAAQV
jgi:RNA polymerase sigma-70 factor (ECF subfamily)